MVVKAETIQFHFKGEGMRAQRKHHIWRKKAYIYLCMTNYGQCFMNCHDLRHGNLQEVGLMQSLKYHVNCMVFGWESRPLHNYMLTSLGSLVKWPLVWVNFTTNYLPFHQNTKLIVLVIFILSYEFDKFEKIKKPSKRFGCCGEGDKFLFKRWSGQMNALDTYIYIINKLYRFQTK